MLHITPMDLIMAFSFLLCVGINFITLNNLSKHQKGLILGVTLPPEADALPEVQSIVQKFRRQLGLFCLACAALCIPLMFVQETSVFLTLWMFWFIVGLALPYLPLFRANAQLKALKRAQGWQNDPVRVADTDTPIVADEDDAWLGGLLYYNPTDKRFMVSKRIGLGTTVNLGTLAGKIYYAFVGLILVSVLAIGPVFGIVDSIPTHLEVVGTAPVTLVASHGNSEKYSLSADTITDLELRDTLPDAARTWGTGMDHYLQGDFYVVNEGPAQFCLDPTQKLFLRVEVASQGQTTPTVYWFTGEDEEHTAAIAQWLEETCSSH